MVVEVAGVILGGGTTTRSGGDHGQQDRHQHRCDGDGQHVEPRYDAHDQGILQ